MERSLNATTRDVIGAAIRVHKELGPGLLERAYRDCMLRVLEDEGLDVSREVVVPATFEGDQLDVHYRMDLIVEDTVPVELKAIETIHPVHESQLLTYLRLGDYPVGLLVNFHVAQLLDGVHRVINPDR